MLEKITLEHFQEIISKISNFVKDDKFFGKGIAELLCLIDKCGTIHEACKSMRMSSSKAWKMITRLEKEIGFKVLDSQAGGKNGGVSCLTKESKDLLNKFKKMTKEIEICTKNSFRKYFLL